MKIVFMGTPDFAVASLEALQNAGHTIAAVVTSTDKMGGRGNKQLIQSAVKQYADAHNLPTLQPEKLRDETFLQALRACEADLFVVVAFRMLPEVVWAMPRLGTINLHGSLLPKYRGAAPINWAIMNGEKETGVTTFFLKQAIDTGNILACAKTPIAPDENFGQVYERLKHIGAKLVVDSLRMIDEGKTDGVPQDDANATPAPKLFLDNTRININQTAEEVHNFIRGLAPFPTAWTTVDGQMLKVFGAELTGENSPEPNGTIITDSKKFVKIVFQHNILSLSDVQLAGKKRMEIKDFLNGYTIKNLKIE